MSVDIIVPQLGESVTEATIAKWLKKVGDPVAMDEPLIELETDKVTLEVNAQQAGVLSEILFKEGDNVEVGSILGRLGESKDSIKVPAPAPMTIAAPVKNETSTGLIASPAARKMIEENKVSAASIPATGKDQRITKEDVINFMDAKPQTTPRPSIPMGDRPHADREERVKMSRLRQRIAERLKEAQNNAAMLTTFNEVDMSELIKLRAQYKDGFEKKHGIKLGFMSFFVKACLVALKEIPAINAEIDGTDIVYKNYYDIGVAVGSPQGLVVPIVRDADVMSFAEVEKNISDLGKKARDGKLAIQDLTGGTFTISNGGVYGSLMSTPILNPPQSGILGMHKIQERPMAINGQVLIRPMMYLALSYDHRIVDGKEAVTFLVRVKECIEDPHRLLLDV